MKGIRQTTFRPSAGPGAGNCFQAALASLFELELDQVPHFAELPEDVHFGWAVEDWLRERGWGYIEVNPTIKGELVPWFSDGALALVHGWTDRKTKHVVVARLRVPREEDEPLYAEWAWDPNPADTFLEKITAFWLLFPIDPARTRLELQDQEHAHV